MSFINRSSFDIIYSSKFLFVIPLALSVFTYLWNPLGFIPLKYDEGTYIGRAMHVLVAHNPQEETFYDHPYFGQLFLGSMLWIMGYPNSVHPSAVGDVVDSVKMLWLVPRVLIGIIGVIDTFLVYKISERRYNTKVAFIAAILFAVMPIAFIRTIFLESLQLPLLLSSILFAVNIGDSIKNKDTRKNVSMILLSSIFMGLAIFTKISVFMMIPMVGFIIFKSSSKKAKIMGLWFIPVILIPLIWPAYALLSGEFDRWWDGIYWQTHRQVENINFIKISNQYTLPNALVYDFFKMPILIVLGLGGLIFATIKKDFFLLLWATPFLAFLYFIGFVRDFHLIPLLPAFCISAARFIEGVSTKVTYKKILAVLPLSIISAIAIFGLINVMIPLTMNNNDDAFAEAAFVARYLQDNKNENITTISSHVFSWIPKYVFHLGREYLIPELDVDETPQNEKVLMVVTGAFRGILSGNDAVGEHLRTIYNEHSKNGTSMVELGRDKIIIPQPWSSRFTSEHETNLIDNEHVWKSDHKGSVSQTNGSLNISVKTNKTDQTSINVFLQTQLKNLSETPLLLSLDYTSKSPNTNTKFFVEITDSDDHNKRYFMRNLSDTSDKIRNKLWILPRDLGEKPIKFRFGIVTSSSGEYLLSVKRAAIIFSV